jgi:hypothetical protein
MKTYDNDLKKGLMGLATTTLGLTGALTGAFLGAVSQPANPFMGAFMGAAIGGISMPVATIIPSILGGKLANNLSNHIYEKTGELGEDTPARVGAVMGGAISGLGLTGGALLGAFTVSAPSIITSASGAAYGGLLPAIATTIGIGAAIGVHKIAENLMP